MADAKKLSSLDASFLYLETPEMPMHVGSMAIFRLPDGYKGDFFEEFKAMILSRLHIAPILKARLEKAPLDIDHPSWVEDDQFDIDRHIFRASLPAPRDRATLERIVGWMHAKLLNRARPLWEFYVFEGMKDNEIGLYSKMHHACIDGGAGATVDAGMVHLGIEPDLVVLHAFEDIELPERTRTVEQFCVHPADDAFQRGAIARRRQAR